LKTKFPEKQPHELTGLGTRANLSYLDALAKYHKQHGTNNLQRWPYVDKKPLDLYRLKKAVEARGGFDKVCKLKKWAEIGRDLGYSGKIMSSLSTSLKNSYQKWLCPYEEYLIKNKERVIQQLELEQYGGPLTPSPAPSPMKRSNVNTPSSLRAESPARHATDALQGTVNGQTNGSDRDADTAPQPTTAFTAINTGGFTAVNSGFTSVNRPLAPAGDSKGPTPTKQFSTPISSAKNTPEYRPSGLGPSSLKRQHSCDSLDSAKKDSATDKEDGEAGSRRSKRLKKGQCIFCLWHTPFMCLQQANSHLLWFLFLSQTLQAHGLTTDAPCMGPLAILLYTLHNDLGCRHLSSGSSEFFLGA